MKNKEPKILVVNAQSIFDNNATGITLKSIFSNYKSELIKEVYYSQEINGNDKREGHDNLNRIESFCLPISTVPLNYFIRKIIGRKKIENYNSTINCLDIRSKEAKKNKKVALKSFVLGLINNSPLILNNKNILEQIDRFSPDLIYTLGADIIPLKMALFFSKRYDNIPILIHYMDNWPKTKYCGAIWSKVFYKKLHQLLSDIQKNNKIALVISDKMALEYNRIFSPVKHYSLMNTVDTSLYNAKSIYSNKPNNVVIFAYLGGLHLNRDKQLLLIADSIKMINKEFSTQKAILRIYTGETDKAKFKKEFDSSCVEFCDYVPHEKVFNEYNKADVLVHIESFDTDLIEFTKYSISTKISEYMFAGKPILLFAPSEIAVFQYIKSCGCGICVDNTDDMMKAIKMIISDKEKRDDFGRKGYNQAIKRHTNEAAFQTLINACNELMNE